MKMIFWVIVAALPPITHFFAWAFCDECHILFVIFVI
jgi:hypothetical protein